VQKPDLDIKHWSASSFSKLGALIMANKSTQENKVSYTQVLVKILIMKQVTRFTFFKDEHDILMQQEIVFKWKMFNVIKEWGMAMEA